MALDPATLGLALVLVGLAFLLGRAGATQRFRLHEAMGRREAEALKHAHMAEVAALRREAELRAREEGVALRGQAEMEFARHESDWLAAEASVVGRQAGLEAQVVVLDGRRRALKEVEGRIGQREREAEMARRICDEIAQETHRALERAARETASALREAIVEEELEVARQDAADMLRHADLPPDVDHPRRARRLLDVAVGRFSGHYLTERLHSHIALGSVEAARSVIGENQANLRAIEAVAHVNIHVDDAGDGVRLEGLDGVGREVARRCLQFLLRHPRATDPVAAFRDLAARVQREVDDLGRKAFRILDIPVPHGEIVKLVGRLNWRTSYTQNQWKHAVEVAFLCGMMADEVGLDVKVARRAALMHDIGKSLTHELDGSHAVIGADVARRLGESEIVANAIGAHHLDEPWGSPYAYLVAAADAMSGARPGARRMTEESYVSKIGDLERITRGTRGVDEAFAVQGGREVRVYVQQTRVSDAEAVAMSTEIAKRISDEMTFPGQIKVTVIREFRAQETAH